MPPLTMAPPATRIDTVTDVLHGIFVPDPYRWLEDQSSTETRSWIESQTGYARSYLDAIAGRKQIRERVRRLVDVETHDSLLCLGGKYVFRKRTQGAEQPCIFLRDGLNGEDLMLIDPLQEKAGKFVSVRPLMASPDGRLLLYEIKQGGERSSTFRLFDLTSHTTLPDGLPRGYLQGFAFGPESGSFYYIHRPAGADSRSGRIAYHHRLGSSFTEDEEIFSAGNSENISLRMVSGTEAIGFLVYQVRERIYTDFYYHPFNSPHSPQLWLESAPYRFVPRLLRGRMLALTDRHAPNSRIVRVRYQEGCDPEFEDVVGVRDTTIQNWLATENRIFVTYSSATGAKISVFDTWGNLLFDFCAKDDETIRLVAGWVDMDEVFFEQESFTSPKSIYRYSPKCAQPYLWSRRELPVVTTNFHCERVLFTAKDGAEIPMFLVGRADRLNKGPLPTIMTSYGGFGVSMMPQFSAFTTLLIEHGCLFALPGIRGGSEFGADWHHAGKRRNRSTSISDFLAAAEWLIETERTTAQKLAIFGGSNAGLLVGAALTQRPELFRAAICIAPLLDMIRFHLFDQTQLWHDEFGTPDNAEDFAALLNYSPYHQVRDRTAYPATLLISGDADQNCNGLHARKMTARLQAANISLHPILLDYSEHRGHSPVLPLSHRIDALTDRLAFLCQELQLKLQGGVA